MLVKQPILWVLVLSFHVVQAQLKFIKALAGTGSPSFSEDNLSPSSAALSSPSGLWIDSNGDIFLADSANHRVRKISASTKTISTGAGSSAGGGFGGDGSAATSTSVKLNNPQGVWVSTEGVLFIADTDNCRVRRVSSPTSGGIINTFAGSATGCGLCTNNTAATSTMLSKPQAVMGDSLGVLFISDTNNHVVLKVQSGIVTVFAGKISVTGSFTGDGMSATSATLNSPQGLWLTTAGSLLVADSGNHRIRSISLSLTGDNVIRTVMGDGNPTWRGDGGPAVNASLHTPRAVCVGDDGGMYVTDAGNHRVRVVEGGSNTVVTLSGKGSGPATSFFSSTPTGIALDSFGNLFVSEWGNNKVLKLSPTRNIATDFFDQLNRPYGLFIDTSANLFIADADNRRVLKINLVTNIFTIVMKNLAAPRSIFVNTAGVIFMGENSRIRRMDLNGSMTTILGSGGWGSSPDGALANADAQVGVIFHIFVDSIGNIYFADTEDNKIRTISEIDNKLGTFAGNGNVGYNASQENLSALSASLDNPKGFWFDSLDNCFIADFGNNRIRKVTAGSRLISTVVENGIPAYAGDGGHPLQASLQHPWHVIGDNAGHLYVTDHHNNVVRKIDLISNIISTIMGYGKEGGGGVATEGSFATSSFLSNPHGVMVDTAGTVYVTDKGNHKLRTIFDVAYPTGQPSSQPTTMEPSTRPTAKITVFTNTTAPPSTFSLMNQLKFIKALAGNGSAAFSGDNLSPSSAALSSPSGLWMDSNGDIFLADSTNHRVRKISASTNTISTVAGSGGGFGGDGSAATSASAKLKNPQGVWVSSVGVVYIADTDNCRIRSVYLPSNPGVGIISTFAGNGTCGLSTNNTAATSTMLSRPQAIVGDPSGVLFISDTNNHVVLKVQNGTGIVTVFAGKISATGSFTGDGMSATSATLNSPQGLWLTTAGSLLVADSGNHRIRSISLSDSNNIIRTVVGDGNPTWRGDGGPAVNASLQTPRGVCVGGDGGMYVADTGNDRIRVVEGSTGIVFTLAGKDNGPASSAFLNYPTGIALNDGYLFIADYGNNKVRRLSLATNIVVDFVIQLKNPQGLFIDTVGDLFIADTRNYRLQKMNMTTDRVSTIMSGLSSPFCVFANTAGAIYSGEYGRIRRRNLDGSVTVIVGTGTVGSSPDGTIASNTVSVGGIYHIFIDSVGTIYFSDYSASKIRTINSTDNKLGTFAGNGNSTYLASHENIAATSASLNKPTGFWFDSVGNCFVADYWNHRIRKVSSSSRFISTVAGNGVAKYAGDGGNPSQASLFGPGHVVGDNAGNLYVTDRDNHRVRKIDLINNIISTVMGYGVMGGGGIATEGSFATSSFLSSPHGVMVDAAGSVHFTDKGNHKLRTIFDIAYPTGQPSVQPTNVPSTKAPTQVYANKTVPPSTFLVQTPLKFIKGLAGTGTATFSGENISPSSAALSSPSGLWMDSNGDIFLADSANHRVRKISASTNTISTVAGSSGGGSFGGDGSAATSTSVKLNNPQGVWVSTEGVLFIADTDNCRVRRVSSPTSGSIISTFAGSATGCGLCTNNTAATSTKLSKPQAVIGNSAGAIFISDTNNHVILKVQRGTGIVTVFAGKISATGFFTGDGMSATSATLNSPQGLWLTTAGFLLVADSGNHRIRSISLTDSSNIIRTVVGDGNPTWRGDGGPAVNASVHTPRGVCVGGDGGMYVTDFGNHRVRVVEGSTGIVRTIAGKDSGPTTTAFSNNPTGIALDEAGNLFVAEWFNNKLRKISLATNIVVDFVTALKNPRGLFIDTVGNLFIADANNNRVQKINMTTNTATTVMSSPYSIYSVFVTTAGVIYTGEVSRICRKNLDGSVTIIIGAGTMGSSPDGTHAGTNAAAGSITHLMSDSLGTIYFADFEAHKVRTINSTDNLLRTLAGNGNTVYSASHENVVANSASLNNPAGFWLDSVGNCFIADFGNHRIRKVTAGNRLISTLAGNGVAGYTGDGGHPLQASLNNPFNLIGDGVGHLYVTDHYNHRVRKIDLVNNIISTFIPSGDRGTGGIATEGSFATSSFLRDPYGVIVDTVGSVYFTDKGNHKLRTIFDVANPTGQPSSQPSTQPTTQPSRQPTRQPTAQPTRQPSTQPSMQPTTPTSQPTERPSAQPTSQPTAQPSSQPFSQPSHRPTAQPTAQPTTQPASQPTTQPSSQPSHTPTTQPTSQPSHTPTTQPSSQPSQTPTTQPTSQPSSQPSSQPTSQPLSQPTHTPTTQPTSQPSHTPTTQPTLTPTTQPTNSPSAQPTSSPFATPTARPTTQPSVQPSAQPTCLPSTAPSSQPSHTPSSQPSAQPIKAPSAQPISGVSSYVPTESFLLPTVEPWEQLSREPSDLSSAPPTISPSSQPTGSPSAQPTSTPTSSPTVLPTANHTTQAPMQPTARSTSSQPSSKPSAKPLAQPTERFPRQPYAQPTRNSSVQSSFEPSSLPTSAPFKQVRRQPTLSPSAQTSNTRTTQPTTQPTNSPSAQPTSSHFAQPTAWPTTQPSVQPSAQPTCLPSSEPSHTPSSQPSREDFAQPSEKPLEEPSRQPSAHPTRDSSAQLSSGPSSLPSFVSFKPLRRQPTLLPTTQPTSRPSLKVLSTPITQPSSQPSSQPSTQTSSPTKKPTKLLSTQPSVEPTTRLVPQRSHTPSSQPSAVPSTEPFSQPTQRTVLQPTRDFSAQPSVKPSSLPNSQPSEEPRGQPTLSRTPQPTTQPTLQPSHTPTAQPSSTPSAQPTGLPSARPSSVPSNHPSPQPTNCPSTQPSRELAAQLTVKPTRRPSAQPSLTPSHLSPRPIGESRDPVLFNASFSSDGSYLLLFFDKASDRAGTSEFFVCSELFLFACAESSRCQWKSSMFVHAYPPTRDECVSVGDTVRLQRNATLRAECVSSTINCSMPSSWPISNVSLSVRVLPPVNPVRSTVSLSAPTMLSSCASLTLDASASTGNGGKSWTSATVNVSVDCLHGQSNQRGDINTEGNYSCDEVFLSVSSLQHWLDLYFTVSPPTVIPAGFLVAGYNYTFSLTLCNVFSQCGESSARVSVRDTLLPVVIIPGPLSRSVKRSQSLSLSAVASLPGCLSSKQNRSNDATNSGKRNSSTTMTPATFYYRWTLHTNNGNGTLDSVLVSSSRDPSRLLLSSYALLSDCTYTITVTVSASSTLVIAQSASASVAVNVLRGDVVARLKGGTSTRTLRAGGRLSLDASSSLDEDVQPGKEREGETVSSALTFEWSCEQLSPVRNNSCLSVFSAKTFLASMHSSVLELLSLSSSAKTLSAVSLTVREVQSGRRDSLSVRVQVLSALSPTVSLSSNIVDTQRETGRAIMNSDKSLQLFAAVSVPSEVFRAERERELVMSWSADMMSQSGLSSVALSLLSTSMSITHTQNASSSLPLLYSMSLILPRNVLLGGLTYTFTFTSTVKNASTISTQAQSQILIAVNAAPSPGVFSVTPSQQKELSSPFSFFCGNWQDDELPLSFSFAYYTASLTNSSAYTQEQLVIRSRSEKSFASLFLPVGSAERNYTVITAANVYDSLSAMNTAEFTVRVLPASSQSSMAQLEATLSSLFTANDPNTVVNVDMIKQQTAIGSSLLNTVSVNCSLAPNCSALRRQNCMRTSHTCGPCLSRDFVGDSGDRNNPCVSQEEFALVKNNNSTNTVMKTCTANCSSHGHCVFRSLSTQALLTHCFLYDLGCFAQCVCEEGYKGTPHCAVSDAELVIKHRMRERIVRSVASLAALEDDSESAITERINAMNAATLISDELSINATSDVLRFVNDTLRTISSQGYDSLFSAQRLLSTISTAAEAIKLQQSLTSPSNETETETDTPLDGEDIQRALQSLGELCTASMTKDQFPQSWLYDSFSARVQRIKTVKSTQLQAQTKTLTMSRTLIQSLYDDEIFCEHNTTIVLPQPAQEKALGVTPHILTVPSCRSLSESLSDSVSVDESVSVVALSLSTALYSQSTQSQFHSQPLALRLSELPCGDAAMCNVTLSVPWTDTQSRTMPMSPSYEEEEQTNVTSSALLTCNRGFVGVLDYPCTAGVNVSVQCNGTFALVDVVCPRERYVPSCGQLYTDNNIEIDVVCSLQSFVNDTLTCTCAMQRDRDRDIVRGRRDLQTTNASLPSTVSVTVVGMLRSTASSFLLTVRAADDLDASVLQTGGPVLGTLGGFLCVVILGMWVGARWDLQEERDKKKGKDGDNDKISHTDKVAVTANPYQSPRGNNNNNSDSKDESVISLLDRSLPLFLRAQSLATKTKAALQQHHRWFQVYFVHSAKLRRMLRVFSLATNTVIMLFAQSIFYHLSQGDDGSCDALHSETECVALRSAYRNNAQQCVWDAHSEQCVYLQPDGSLRVILFVAVLSSTVSVPLAMLADWLIVEVLAAPTVYGPWSWAAATHRVQTAGEIARLQQHGHKQRIEPLPQQDRFSESNAHEKSLWDAQSAWRELDSSLRRYRAQLSAEDKRQFDEQWGLQESGQYLPIKQNERSWMDCIYVKKATLPVHSQLEKSVADCIRKDIERAMTIAAREHAEFHQHALPLSETERNQRILFHFQTDLLVGLSEETLEAQDRREHLLLQPRHVHTQRTVWMLLTVTNLGMLFYLFLFGVSQDTHRQRAWAQSFATWLLMEIIFYSSLVALISHVLVPSLLLRNAAEMRRRLIASLIRCQRDLRLNRKPLHQQNNASALTTQHTPTQDSSFNAASFLFVSHRLAQSNPQLRASQLVLAYHTPWPRESYCQSVSVHNEGNQAGAIMSIAQATDAFIAVSVFLLTTFLKLPNQSQDIFLRLLITLAVAYISSWHLSLYEIHPVLVVVPGCVCAVIAFFGYKFLQKSSELEILKVDADVLSDCDQSVSCNDNQKEKSEDNWRSFASSEECSDQVIMENFENRGKTEPVRAHMNRRQSIQEGLRILEQQRLLSVESTGSAEEGKLSSRRSSSKSSHRSDSNNLDGLLQSNLSVRSFSSDGSGTSAGNTAPFEP